jgi:hypothetical protein
MAASNKISRGIKEVGQWLLPKAEEKVAKKAETGKKASQYGLPAEAKSLTMHHPISRMEREMPRALEEMSHTTEKSDRLLPKKTIHPEELVKQRALIISGGFDRSPTGVKVTGINGEPLDVPVDMLGGIDFGRGKEGQGPDRLIGKSGGQVIQKKAKETRLAAERFGEDRPIYFSPWAMSHPSVDFNEMQARMVIERMKTAKMTDEDLLALELMLAEKSPPKGMQFPGFRELWKDPDLKEEYLAKAGTGRTNLSRIPEMARWQDKGATDIASIRKAGIDPDLLDQRFGDTGRVFYQADPSGRVVDNPSHKRADYDTGWGGTGGEVLGFKSDIPLELMQPDAVASMRRNMQAKGTDPDKLTMNMIANGIELGAPVQEATPQWLEGIMRYVDRHGLKMAIAAGVLTPAQAMTHFGSATGETTNGL